MSVDINIIYRDHIFFLKILLIKMKLWGNVSNKKGDCVILCYLLLQWLLFFHDGMFAEICVYATVV